MLFITMPEEESFQKDTDSIESTFRLPIKDYDEIDNDVLTEVEEFAKSQSKKVSERELT